VPRTITTGVSRRHGPLVEELGFSSRFVSGQLQPTPAVAKVPPRPYGELGGAPADRIVELTKECWDGDPLTIRRRGRAARAALSYLSGFNGDTWQQRWDASPLGCGEAGYHDLEAANPAGSSVSLGFRSLFCLRVVQPSLLAFRRSGFLAYAPYFIQAQHDPLLDTFAEHLSAQQVALLHRQAALLDISCLLTVQGVALADVTPAALLAFSHETRRVRAALLPGSHVANQFVGQLAWNVLHHMGHFPAATPTTMRAAMHRGQLTVEELVDRYPITNQAVRQLLIDYLHRRAADTDYASLSGVVRFLAHHFWEKLEALSPGQADLRIAPEVYSAWRETIGVRSDGKPRGNRDDIVIAVRSFYYDLHTWAADEPQRWGRWVAPCPVPPGELRGLGKRRRRINERSADRTRQRQPLLPILVRYVEDRYDHNRALLERARHAAIDEPFVLAGRTYRRVVTAAVLKKNRDRPHEAPVRVLEEATGRVVRVEHDEDDAFWDWACIETLRHSGVRIEELCELTHLSVRQYQRANGEVIALLVIAPSKTDRERVIPMSAELFHVIASVIRRHTHDGVTVPLLSRFDPHDKVWSAPMPFLFQRRRGTGRSVIAPQTVLQRLKRLCAELASQHPAFATTPFTPHDFRRIFATELVNSGLPIHIGAALLGHLNV